MPTIVVNESLTHEITASVYREDGSETIYRSVEHQDTTDVLPVDVDFQVHKAINEDQMLVSGWASVAYNSDGSRPLDWQGDILEPDTLEKAAVQFMLDYRGSGEMHRGDSVGTIVESMVFTTEKQAVIGIPEGCVPQGWFITVKLFDRDAFQKVKDGTYRMFSIQGHAKRIER